MELNLNPPVGSSDASHNGSSSHQTEGSSQCASMITDPEAEVSDVYDTSNHRLGSDHNTSSSHHAKTSLRSLTFKHICIISEDSSLSLGKYILKSKKMSFVIGHLKNRSETFINDICARDVWAIIRPQTKHNKDFVQFAQKIMDRKIAEYGVQTSDIEPKRVGFRILLCESATMHDIPPQLAVVTFVDLNIPDDQMVKFIEGRYNRNLDDLEKQVRNKGTFIKLVIKLFLQLEDQQLYMRRACEVLKELLNDGSSYPRQHLLQLYKIPNVQVLEHHSKDTDQVCIEIRPHYVKEVMQLARACDSGSFAEMLRSHLKVNREPFLGGVEVVSWDTDDIRDLVTQLQPCLSDRDLTNRHNLEESVQCLEVDNDSGIIQPLKALAAAHIYQSFLDHSGRTPYEFLCFIRQSGCKNLLLDIRSPCGYNALHMAIKAERQDFMKMLFYSGTWVTLRQQIVPQYVFSSGSLHSHRGYTPKRLADALSYRCNGHAVQSYFDKLDTLYRKLPPLCTYCMLGQMDAIRLLVEHQPYRLQQKDLLHNNCLIYACAAGNEKVVEYLLEKGVPRVVFNDEKQSAAHIAAMFGHMNIMVLLFKKVVGLEGLRDRAGYCPLDYSTINGDKEMLQRLKNSGFPLNPRVLTTVTSVSKADSKFGIIQHLVETIKMGVNSGTDIDQRLPIHHTVIGRSENTLQLLLKYDADIHKQDQYNFNVFHLAALHQDERRMVDMLKEACIHKAGSDGLNRLLSEQCYFTGKDETFVVRGKDRGRKAWHWVEIKRLSVKGFRRALASGQIDVVRFGKIHYSGFGQGPDKAAENKMKERINELLSLEEGGCQPDMTPLHVAVLKEKVNIVAAYLQYGANPNTRDYYGATPMHYAAMNGNVTILKMLEDAKAEIRIKTSDGQTAEQIADENENDLAVHFFKAKVIMERAKKFVTNVLDTTKSDLSYDQLMKVRQQQCVKKHIIDTLRNLSIDINLLLLDLGSGPVLEESNGR